MKLDFLLCAAPDDGFYSQVALFRASLDRLGGQWRDARLVVVFGAEVRQAIPRRWRPYFDRIEVEWADPAEHRRQGCLAQCHRRYEVMRSDADLAFLCDADTTLLRPIPVDMLSAIHRSPVIAGVVAHYPFPNGDAGTVPCDGTAGAREGSEAAWRHLARVFLGRDIELPLRYTLQPAASAAACPFYVNYGFVASTPALFRHLYAGIRDLADDVRKEVGNRFFAQVALALAVEKLGLPWRALPMRYNFPNDEVAERLYPEELEQVVVLHFLRENRFARREFVASEAGFRTFCALDLKGSNDLFRDHVLRLTGGRYPFG